MVNRPTIKALMNEVASSYAAQADVSLDNTSLYESLVKKGAVSKSDIEDRTAVGRSGAKYSFVQRRVRWVQQEAKRAGLLERDPARRGVWRLTGEGKKQFVRPEPKRVLLGYSTKLGIALWGAAEDVFAKLDEPIVLACSSPPYPLAKGRAYGNPSPQDYVDFISRIVEPIAKNLAHGGSIVLNVSSDVFEEESPARSTYLERMVIALEDRLSLKLMDRWVWFNNSKPPGPTHWASKKRVHLNVAWEPCFWFTNAPLAVKSDNRRVLMEHTKRQMELIAGGGEQRDQSFSDGAYTLRAGRSFANATEGRIPRNVFSLGHRCGGQDKYKAAAESLGLPVHGAPFPESLVDLIVRFLSEPGDLCVDFCAGSQTMPAVCERLGRRWASAEIMGEYIRGGAERLRGSPGFKIYDDLIDGLRLKFQHPTMNGQQAFAFEA